MKRLNGVNRPTRVGLSVDSQGPECRHCHCKDLRWFQISSFVWRQRYKTLSSESRRMQVQKTRQSMEMRLRRWQRKSTGSTSKTSLESEKWVRVSFSITKSKSRCLLTMFIQTYSKCSGLGLHQKLCGEHQESFCLDRLVLAALLRVRSSAKGSDLSVFHLQNC